MSVENLEQNGNQVQDESQNQEESQKVGALSVPNAVAKNSQLNLKFKESGTIYGNRPVEASHLKIVKSFDSVGSHRPITESDLEVSGTLTISGNRPIAASHLKVSETYIVMGNRPVASNQIDDATTLMGYLD